MGSFLQSTKQHVVLSAAHCRIQSNMFSSRQQFKEWFQILNATQRWQQLWFFVFCKHCSQKNQHTTQNCEAAHSCYQEPANNHSMACFLFWFGSLTHGPLLTCNFDFMMESDEEPEPKRRRRGGLRQRLVADEKSQPSQVPRTSHLADSLLEKWAWGAMSPGSIRIITFATA